MTPQLIVSAFFSLFWLGLAIYLLWLYRGPEQLWQMNTRWMGIAALLLAGWNLARLVLEWQRLRRQRLP